MEGRSPRTHRSGNQRDHARNHRQRTGSLIVIIEREILIARAAPEIFDALTNFGPASPWYTGVLDAIADPPGPIRAGSRVTQVRVDGGRREETRYLVESYERDRELRLQSIGVKPASTIGYRIGGAPSGSLLTCAIRVETGGILRLVESRLRRDLERKLGATLEAFKETMEGP